jgi:hypothetical protein
LIVSDHRALVYDLKLNLTAPSNQGCEKCRSMFTKFPYN